MHATESVAEFEIAHIWIFFVGCYYVVMAFQNIKIAADLTAKSQRRHLISKENLLSQLQNNSQRRDCCCRCRRQRSGADLVDQPEPAASSTLLGFFSEMCREKRFKKSWDLVLAYLTFQSMKSTSFVMRCWQAFMFRCCLGLGSICFS